MTPRQKEVLAAIRGGQLRSVETGTHFGRTVLALLNRGVIGYTLRQWSPPETTYWGRHNPGSTYFGGLFVKEDRP